MSTRRSHHRPFVGLSAGFLLALAGCANPKLPSTGDAAPGVCYIRDGKPDYAVAYHHECIHGGGHWVVTPK